MSIVNNAHSVTLAGVLTAIVLTASCLTAVNIAAADRLVGRAVRPAATFAPGPTSGRYLGDDSINGQEAPFVHQQPVQGFSAVLDNGDGTFNVMSDNGFGSQENSADYVLRVYTIYPDFETRDNGSGQISVQDLIELHDPDKHISFAITHQFTHQRVLTGADFDIESMQRVADGTLWFGDEFGPFLLHTDAQGRVLEPPVRLPDFDNKDQEIRAPQNPFIEEDSTLRIMNAVRAHALKHGNTRAPVVSPLYLMLADGNPDTFVDTRENPPRGAGLERASSEIIDIKSLQSAGFPVVPYTVDDPARMQELMELGVDGLISDRPDLLRQGVEQFNASGNQAPGDLIDARGLIDPDKFDAQGHRGARGLRPENTLPAMEAALDFLMSTLETDNGVTADRVPVLSHDPFVSSDKCRRADGAPYAPENEVLIKDVDVTDLQTNFICDRVLPDFPEQSHDLSLSPVAIAFAGEHGLMHPYLMPTTQQLFDFVDFYVDYYRDGPGSSHPDALRRWQNAAQVRFNIETKINPRPEFKARTVEAGPFTQAVAGVITANGMQARADIQSFDFRTLLIAQARFPKIRTVYLFGDFPHFADPSIEGSDDGTNLQPDASGNTPWLAGLYWPYRTTALTQPFRAQTSGGFEGMALTTDGASLLPLLEKPLAGDDPDTLLIHEFDLADKSYTGTRFEYPLDPRGESIGDFVMFSQDGGLVIERDNTQGDVAGFKAIYEIALNDANKAVGKQLAVDLLNIQDPHLISEPGDPGDVGIGQRFAFPFVTIEDVVVLNRGRIGVLNDNDFPFSIGRHVATGAPDDDEFIVIQLDRPVSGKAHE